MRLLSPDFEQNGKIPERHTCVGQDINPSFYIEDVPPGTRSMALTVHDPDSKYGTWVHWVVYDIPAVTPEILEDSVPGKQGTNSFKKRDYGGPCPAIGTHRYVFTVYALDTEPNLPEGLTMDELKTVMHGHVLAKAELVGLFQKPPVPKKYEEIRI